MFNKFTRAMVRTTVVTATVAAASVVAIAGVGGGTAHAAPPIGVVAISPPSGNSDTPFGLTPSDFPDPATTGGGAYCSGSGANGWRWQTYIVDSGVDPSTLTFGTGPLPQTGHYVSRLYDDGGNAVSNKNPTTTGQITDIPTFSFAQFVGAIAPPPGEYKIGLACSKAGVVDNGRYWQTTITITSNTINGGTAQFNYAVGTRPVAPVLATPLTVGNQTLDGTFTPAASNPATTGYTVTAVPQGGGTTITAPLAANATSFHLTGLVNGTQYAVTVKATNSIGDSVASNSVNGTPGIVPSAPVLTSPLVAGNQTLAGSFTSTPSTPSITGYTVTASPTGGGTPVTASLGAAATAFVLSGLVNGTQYSVTVQAVNSIGTGPASNAVSGTPGTIPAAPVLSPVLQSGNTTLDGTFTPGPSAPAATAYTVTAIPTTGTTVTLLLAANATTFHVTGLVNNVEYTVTVKATNSFGDSAPSNSAKGTPGLVPAPPVLASPLVAGNQTLNGTFSAASANPPITAFTVTAVPTSGTTVTITRPAGSTTFQLVGLTNGTQYSVTVKSTNAIGSSAASNTVVGTPGTIPNTPVLGTVVAGDKTLSGTFTPGASQPAAIGYTVTAVPTSGATVAISRPPSATSFQLVGLVNGMQYTVTVTATNAFGNSAASNAVTGTPGLAPAAPVLSSPLTVGDETLDGTFTSTPSSPAITGFTVRAVPTSGATVTLALPANATSFNLTGLVNGTQYSVTVVASNSIGIGAASNAVLAAPVSDTAPGLVSFTPGRVLDSRIGGTTVDGQSAGIGLRDADSVTEVQVAGRAGVPIDALAVVLNVTATEPQGAGYVTVFPCGSPRPTASNLNYGVGDTAPNTVLSKLGSGKICLFTQAAAHLIVDINGYFPAGSSYTAVNPARLLETRADLTTIDGQANGGGLRAAGSITELQIVGRAGVPQNTAAAVLNVTVTEADAAGYVTVFPCDSPQPNASSVNYAVGKTVANSVIIKVGAAGNVCLFTQSAAHLVVDINGFFPDDGSFEPVVPGRVLDSRANQSTVDGQGSGIGRRAAGSVTELQITGRAGVPATASAVVLNVTATGPDAAGFLTVFPCGSEPPNSSNLNYTVDSTVANAAIAKLGSGGKVCFFTQSAIDLVVDVNGYLTAS